MQLTVTPKQLSETLATAFKHRLRVLIKGSPGIGKTDLVKTACAAAGAELLFMHPAISDPTDFKGMPATFTVGKMVKAEFIPFGDLNALIEAKVPTVCFVDDIGQAPHGVQAALMQLLQERRVNGHKISEHITFCGATNDSAHRAGVQGLLETVKSRFDTIVELVVDVDDWCAWANGPDEKTGCSRMPPEVVGFIRFRRDLLHKFEPTRELTNSPCPRTVAALGAWVNAGVTSLPVLAGAVGSGFAAEFLGFLRIYRSLPSIDQILLDPQNAKVPTDPATCYAVATALARRFTPKSARAIFTYAARLNKEHEVCLVRDGLRMNDEIKSTPEFTQWIVANGDIFT